MADANLAHIAAGFGAGLVTIGAAIYASMTARAARAGGSDSTASAWQRAARLDALRS